MIFFQDPRIREPCTCGSNKLSLQCCERRLPSQHVCLLFIYVGDTSAAAIIISVRCLVCILYQGPIWNYLHPNNEPCRHRACFSSACLMLPCLIVLSKLANHIDLIKPNAKYDEYTTYKQYISEVFHI